MTRRTGRQRPAVVLGGAMGVLTAAGGLLVLVGWLTGSDTLVRLGTEVRPMAPDSALALVLTGMALAALAWGGRRTARAAALAVVAVAALGVARHFSQLHLGIAALPRLMTLPTGLALVLFASAMLALTAGRRGPMIAALVAAAITTTGLAWGVSAAVGLPAPATWPAELRTSAHTGFLLALAGIGLMALAWERDRRPGCGPVWLPLPVAILTSSFALLAWVAEAASAGPAARPHGEGVLLAFGLALSLALAAMLWMAQRAHCGRRRLAHLAGMLEREVAERRAAQGQLAEAHRELQLATGRLSGVIDGTGDLISAVDHDLRFVVINRAFATVFDTIFGCRPVVGARLPDLLAHLPDERDTLAGLYRRALAGETFSDRAELGDVARRRNVYEITSSPLCDESGAVMGAAQIARDVSNRDHAERRMRAEHDLSQAVIDSLPGIFYMLSDSGRFLRWNKNLERVAACTPEDLAEANPLSFFQGAGRTAITDAIRTVQADGRAELEAELISRDGRRMPHYFSARRIAIEGHPCVIGTGLDITALKRAEAALAAKTRALEISNADLEQFAYVASHDLREPLRMISAYVGLLERRYGDRLDDEAREFIGFARDGAQRMDHLIIDLLEYSRVGRRGAPFAAFDAGEAVETALSNLAVAITDSGARIERPGQWPRLFGDFTEVVRLFQNLVGNAVKYRHPDRAPVIRLDAARVGHTWRFAVTDNGIGIDEAQRDRVFMIFQRLHSQAEIEGTGIGLALCKRIVEHHGGRIWVEGAPDQGSTFAFTLPAAE